MQNYYYKNILKKNKIIINENFFLFINFVCMLQ